MKFYMELSEFHRGPHKSLSFYYFAVHVSVFVIKKFYFYIRWTVTVNERFLKDEKGPKENEL